MAQDLTQYVNKKVILVRAPAGGGDAEEIEGTIQAANPEGVLIKPKGKTQFDLVPAAEIDDLRLAPEKDKGVTRKTLRVVELGSARTHLAERHGLTLAEVNGLEEEAAFERHAAIDHEGGDLGHNHGDKAKTERAEAVETAAAE